MSWRDVFIGAALIAASFVPGLNATVASLMLAGGLSFVGKAIPQRTLEQQRQGALVQGASTQNAVRIVYGGARVAGQMQFQEADNDSGDTPNAYLDMVGVLCMGTRVPQQPNGGGAVGDEADDPFNGAIAGAGPAFFDDYQAFRDPPKEVNIAEGWWELDPDGNIYSHAVVDENGNAPAPVAWCWVHLGKHDQAADATMVERWATHEDFPWTEDHRNQGLAYYVVRAFYRAKKFPRGVPNVTIYVKGRRLYDPRPSLLPWYFSDNSSLVVRDYLLDPIAGGAVELALLNEQSFMTVADRCDEVVPTADGSRKRHTINGPVDTARSVKSNVQDMLRCFQGYLVFEQGEFHLRQRVDTAAPVDLVLDQSNIVGDWSFGTGDIENRVNQVIANYIDGTVPSTARDVDTIIRDQALQAFYPPEDEENPYVIEDGGIALPREVDFPFINNEAEAVEAARAELLNARAIVTAALTAQESAMVLGICDRVRIHHPRPDWNMKHFWVEGLGLLSDNTVRVAVREISPGDDYGFPAALPPGDPAGSPVLTFDTYCEIQHGAQQDPPVGTSIGDTGVLVSWSPAPLEDPPERVNYRIQIVVGECQNFDPVQVLGWGAEFDCGRENSFTVDADSAQPLEDSYGGFAFGGDCANKRCAGGGGGLASKWYKARWIWDNELGTDINGPWSNSFPGPSPSAFEDDPDYALDPNYCVF